MKQNKKRETENVKREKGKKDTSRKDAKSAENKNGKAARKKGKNTAKGKSAGGRPSLYKEEYIKVLLDYFDIKAYKIKTRTRTFKDGSTVEIEYREASDFPTLAGFARKIKVCRDTINEWGKEKNKNLYEGFSDALKRAKDCQEDILITNGLHGLYSTGSYAFTAKNVIGFRDNFGVDMTSKGKEIKGHTYVVPCFNNSVESEATKIELKDK